MDWKSVVHPTLSVPVLPPPEQVVLAYVASRNQYTVGHYRGGSWVLQPPPTGAVTHWVALSPPGTEEAASRTATGGKELPTGRYAAPRPQPPTATAGHSVPKPPYKR